MGVCRSSSRAKSTNTCVVGFSNMSLSGYDVRIVDLIDWWGFRVSAEAFAHRIRLCECRHRRRATSRSSKRSVFVHGYGKASTAATAHADVAPRICRSIARLAAHIHPSRSTAICYAFANRVRSASCASIISCASRRKPFLGAPVLVHANSRQSARTAGSPGSPASRSNS